MHTRALTSVYPSFKFVDLDDRETHNLSSKVAESSRFSAKKQINAGLAVRKELSDKYGSFSVTPLVLVKARCAPTLVPGSLSGNDIRND